MTSRIAFDRIAEPIRHQLVRLRNLPNLTISKCKSSRQDMSLEGDYTRFEITTHLCAGGINISCEFTRNYIFPFLLLLSLIPLFKNYYFSCIYSLFQISIYIYFQL